MYSMKHNGHQGVETCTLCRLEKGNKISVNHESRGRRKDLNSAVSLSSSAQERLAFLHRGIVEFAPRGNGGDPAPHPAPDAGPSAPSFCVHDGNNLFFVRGAVHEELQAHAAVEKEDAKGAEEERDGEAHPFQAVVAVCACPSAASPRGGVVPCVRVGCERGGVEEVTAEGGHEE